MLNILRKSNLYSKFFVVSLFVSLTFCSKAKPMVLSQKEIKSPPSRIIRTCCSFGSNLHILSIEKFLKFYQKLMRLELLKRENFPKELF